MNQAHPVALLRSRWRALTDTRPKLRIRDAAAELGVSELELLQTQFGGDATLLNLTGRQLLELLVDRDDVMALTRNGSVVHERTGPYTTPSFEGPAVGLVVGEEIDLRCFLSHWRWLVAVRKDTRRGTLRSIQVFDGAGDAVHKVYLRSDADAAWFDAWVPEHARHAPIEVVAYPPAVPTNVDVDEEAFRADWLAMQDTHEFFGLLRKHGLHRTHALRIAPPEHAVRVDTGTVWDTLVHASETSLPIMVFVGNRGCIQIHTGPVERVKRMGDWANVLDPRFNLHARETDFAEAWVVTKPTEDGLVTSLEVFDAAGETLAYLFGARKPGIPELPAWRQWCEGLLAHRRV